MNLSTAGSGAQYTITAFVSSNIEHLRLMELGFKEGSDVELLSRSTFCGLMKVKIKGCCFAIRLAEAKYIEVEPLVNVQSLPQVFESATA